jgi:hypothetical protein
VTNEDCIHEEIKIILIQGTLAYIHFRMFRLPTPSLKTKKLKYKKLYFLLLFCRGVENGLSH